MYRISQLARSFKLSRSTLLYYDRVGLLCPSGRSEAGYRLYSTADKERLALICSYRQAGLGIEEIRCLLATAADGSEAVIRQRLQAIGSEIRQLQAQQRLLAGMLTLPTGGELSQAVDKQTWIEMLRAAGMDDQAMLQWHSEFERRAPQAHQAFLLSLGISEQETEQIRKQAASQTTLPFSTST
ncbi:MerR family transcriptional regulator [Trichlorobacter lovleyi]|uniref:Transcriptional regulator, MerR family n=1 Tax=Trichlorobacter lovleyi (strain ATCC BAA-1151 / DSM 17278 / SZ) TaxID=398767 RepID=B3EA47_TRIL1|nr:MerR family transcriptional regulator [Trichlorobacter lovleyi]ACD93875.1 transcriptional regulator, MerR family [Trichlorobacter lovleyi SZ]